MNDNDKERARAMLARFRSKAHLGDHILLSDEIAAELAKQREYFEGVLRDYGNHLPACNYPYGKEYGCKCGWLGVESTL